MKTALGPRIIVALDYQDSRKALDIANRLEPALCRLKVGKELFVHSGPLLVEQLIRRGFDIFLDLKFHDIPNTVAQSCRVAADLGVWMVDIHALGGRAMMASARDAISGCLHQPLLVAVTVLTSHGSDTLAELGFSMEPADLVQRLVGLARSSGMDGVVCSAREARSVREGWGENAYLVTPGIRPQGTPSDDQNRTATPFEAIAAGANYLVIGRPITRSSDPMAVLASISSELDTFQ